MHFKNSKASGLISCLLCLTCASRGTHDTTVEFYIADGYRFSQAERDAIQTVADATALDVRRLLPALPRQLILRVEAGKHVIPETGETGTALPPNIVSWTVDPRRSGGVAAIVRTQLRASLFHEFHHLVRGTIVESSSIMDHVITEGMATAFERDFGGASPPWGLYPEDVSSWVKELMAFPATARRDQWMVRHPDGRRWIGYRAGTYLIDRAMRSSGESSADLVSTSTENVTRMALTR